MLTDDELLVKVGRMPTKTTTKRSTKKIALRAAKAATKKKAAKAPAKRSHLEIRWAREWERQGGPELVEEYKFHPTRRWRADFAHLPTRTLIEIEGGAYGGRHTRGKGFVEDLDKYATAWLHGFTVLRIGAHQVRGDVIRAVIGRLSDSPESQDSPESWGAGSGACAGEGGDLPAVDHSAGAILWRACGHAGEPPAWLAGKGAEECAQDRAGGAIG